VRLAVAQDDSEPPRSSCHLLVAPEQRHLVRGQRLGLVDGGLGLSLVNGGTISPPTSFDSKDGRTLTVRARSIAVTVTSSDPNHPALICG